MDAPAAPSYRRVPGRTPWFRFGGVSAPSSTLWLGPDHLLKVERTASRESYKRFYFRDIQAILVEEASRWYFIVVFNAAIIFLIALLTITLSRTWLSALPMLALLTSPFIAGLIVNLALGRTSQAKLVTAVGTEFLSSLGRLRRATEALQQISEEVTKVQGAVSTEQLLLKWPAAVATTPRD